MPSSPGTTVRMYSQFERGEGGKSRQYRLHIRDELLPGRISGILRIRTSFLAGVLVRMKIKNWDKTQNWAGNRAVFTASPSRTLSTNCDWLTRHGRVTVFLTKLSQKIVPGHRQTVSNLIFFIFLLC